MRLIALVLSLLLSSSVSGAGRDLEPAFPGPSAVAPGSSATAFAGGRFLTLWEQHAGGGFHLFGALSDAQGNRISDEAFPVVEGVRAQFITLMSIGDTFAAFWRDYAGYFHLAEIDRDGRLLWRRTSPLNWVWATAVWNGSQFLIVGHPPAEFAAEAVLLERDGEFATSRIRLSDRTQVQNVIAMPDRSFLVFVGGFGDLRAIRLSPAGDVGESTVVERAGGTSTTDYYPRSPVAAPVPEGVLVAFTGTQHERPKVLKTAVISGGDAGDAQVLPVTGYSEIRLLRVQPRETVYAVYFVGIRATDAWELAVMRVDAAGKAVDNAPSVIAGGSGGSPGVAFAASGDVMLAVARHPDFPRQIVSYRLPAGAPQVLSLLPSLQQEVRVGANGAGFVAAWNDVVGERAEVHLAAVDAAGVPVSSIQSLPGMLASHAIASGPAEHLLLRVTGGDFVASRVDSHGRVIQDVVVGGALPGFQLADAVWTGAGYVIVWPAFSRLYAAYLPAGAATATVREIALPPPPERWARGAYNAKVAFDGQTALLVWTDQLTLLCPFPGCSTPEYSLVAMRLSAAGEPLDALPTVVAPGVSSAPVIAASDREFLLFLFQEQATRIITASAAGIQVSAPRPVGIDYYTIHDLVWDGRRFIAAAIAMGRYAGLGSVEETGAVRMVGATATGEATASVRVAVRSGVPLLVASVADRFRPYRARAFAESELAPLPPPPPSPRLREVRRLPSGDTRVSFDPVPDADGYIIEVLHYGKFQIIAFARRDETVKDVRWPLDARIRVRAFNAGGISPDNAPLRRRSAGR